MNDPSIIQRALYASFMNGRLYIVNLNNIVTTQMDIYKTHVLYINAI